MVVKLLIKVPYLKYIFTFQSILYKKYERKIRMHIHISLQFISILDKGNCQTITFERSFDKHSMAF